MRLNTYARPIIPILIAYMAGIVLGERIPGHAGWAMAGMMVSAAGVGWQIWKNRSAHIMPLGLILALGYLSIQPWVAPDFPPDHVIQHADGKKWTVTGHVAEAPVLRSHRVKLVVAATELESSGQHFRASGRIRVTVGAGGHLDMQRGDRIRVTGRLKRVYGFHNPGGFNYERYLAFQKIWCRMWVSARRMTLLNHPETVTLARRIDTFRNTVGRSIDQSVSGESRPVLKSLVIGDRSGISPAVRQVFSRTGIGHLLAISGLHVGIVASVAFYVFKWLFSYSRFLLRRAWVSKFAAMLTFLPVVVYGVMAGMSPSTQRAVGMVAVFLLAYLAGKLQDTVNTLAVAGMGILAVYPPALFSVSFQLSFAAVGFIILGVSRPWPKSGPSPRPSGPIMPKIPGLVRDLVRDLVRGLAGGLIGGTTLAILGTLPLVMRTFNAVSLIGIGANLLAVPLVGFIVVPIGLMGMFVYPLSAAVAGICFHTAGFFLDIVLAVIHFLARLPFASLKTFTPSTIETLIYYVLVSMAVLLAPSLLAWIKGIDRRTLPGFRAENRLKIFVLIAVVAALAAAVDGGYWSYQRLWHKDLRVSIIDVGTGSAALVEFPRGPVMLIDGGGFSDNSVFDMGARVVAPFLWRKKIMTVDTIVLSHPNSDHLNGLIYIARHFHVRKLWTNGEAVDTEGYRHLMAAVREAGTVMPPFRHLVKHRKVNGVTVDLLYPPDDFQSKKAADHWRDTNNNGLVIKVALGDVSFLFPGDIEKPAEAELARRFPNAL
ncbi:MAG: DNA internalization-related competence protein ComEC/Rec2, partial [Deltaproteobacteria bacterium]